MTALAQIDTVGIFDKDLVVPASDKTVISVSASVDSDVAGKEIDISDIPVCAVDEIKCPPSLVSAGKPRNLESVDVSEQYKIVLPYSRASLF